MTEQAPAEGNDSVPNTADPFHGPDWDEPVVVVPRAAATSEAEPRRRRIRVSQRKRKRRRRVGAAMMIIGGAILLAGAWLVVTGLMARGELATVRAEVHHLRAQITAGDLGGARATASDLRKHARRAHQLTSGPVWSVAAGLPAGGDPLRTARGITASADTLGNTVAPELIAVSDQLDPATLRLHNGRIDVARIAAVTPALDTATTAMAKATSTIGALPQRTWLSAVDSARSDMLAQLVALGRDLKSADLAVHIAPAMLGQDRPQTYLISFETESELRGTGGLPGAFAIVKADHGKLSFTHFESDSTLSRVTSGLDFGPAYDQLYAGANATDEYADSNVSPHFPYAAQIWVAMWQKYSGEHLDGALAVDPSALSYLLKVTGPVTLPDKTKVSAANVVELTQRTVYAKFSDQAARKDYQLKIARAVSRRLLDSKANTTALIRAAGKAAGERRLLVWSGDPRVEAELTQTSLSGVVPVTSAPYVGLSINNAAANKLDYYVDASLTWRRQDCGSTREATVTITMKNDAPTGLPTYVVGRTGRRGYPAHPGDNRLLVGYLATQGSLMTSVSLNGRPSTAAIGSENGHPVFTVDLELPRGSTQTIVLHLTDPAVSGKPIVLRQPLVRPLTVQLDDSRCK